MQDVRQDVYTLIREILSVDPTKIDHSTPWHELGAESFDLVELIVALRDHFQIEIRNQDLDKIETLNQLIEFIESKKRNS
jgi:acyl carrier protein